MKKETFWSKTLRESEWLVDSLERVGDRSGTEAQLNVAMELLFGAISQMTPAQWTRLMREAKSVIRKA